MKCAWDAYINLLPRWMREPVDTYGRDKLQELRLRISKPPELIMTSKTVWLEQCVTVDDLNFCINAASRYSPWTAVTAANGFLTAPGGHRLGICGVATVMDGKMTGIAHPTSLCIRVARDFSGIAKAAADISNSILIVGCPGSGKTTLLRDLIRLKSDNGMKIAVVDERGELFPIYQQTMCFHSGKRTDVLLGCRKTQGIENVLRCMNPDYIAVDEITAEEDCKALIHAGWCGVGLMATAHAKSKEDLFSRPVYKPLAECGLFQTLIILHADKTWHIERICL